MWFSTDTQPGPAQGEQLDSLGQQTGNTGKARQARSERGRGENEAKREILEPWEQAFSGP